MENIKAGLNMGFGKPFTLTALLKKEGFIKGVLRLVCTKVSIMMEQKTLFLCLKTVNIMGPTAYGQKMDN